MFPHPRSRLLIFTLNTRFPGDGSLLEIPRSSPVCRLRILNGRSHSLRARRRHAVLPSGIGPLLLLLGTRRRRRRGLRRNRPIRPKCMPRRLLQASSRLTLPPRRRNGHPRKFLATILMIRSRPLTRKALSDHRRPVLLRRPS